MRIKINKYRPGGTKRHYLKYKELARELIHQRLELYNQYYNFNYQRIAVRNQCSRWGSCSSKKNLNFNYKLLFLPQSLTDYIIVHELCHLQEMNHSQQFWNLVAQQIPNYKIFRRRLK